jgi:hypothetical protein
VREIRERRTEGREGRECKEGVKKIEIREGSTLGQ